MTNKDDFGSLVKFYNLTITFTHIPSLPNMYRRLGNFTSKDVGTWVIATGTVVQSTQTKTLEKSKLFACDECGAQFRK